MAAWAAASCTKTAGCHLQLAESVKTAVGTSSLAACTSSAACRHPGADLMLTGAGQACNTSDTASGCPHLILPVAASFGAVGTCTGTAARQQASACMAFAGIAELAALKVYSTSEVAPVELRAVYQLSPAFAQVQFALVS